MGHRKNKRRRQRLDGRRLSTETLEARLALSATPIGDATLVNDLIVREQSALDSSSAAVATAENRVVVFEGKGPVDDRGVFAEVYDASGETLRTSFRINTTIEGEQHAPAVGADADGGFVVAWSGRGEGDKHGVFYRRYDNEGVAIGDETLVNSTTGGGQSEPAIAVAADGSFTVAWSGVGSGDVSGVYLQRFNAAGEAVGEETLVNTTTDDHQTAPSIAYDADGSLVVAWQSRHQDGSDWGVYGQWFAADGTTSGDETQLSTTTTASQSAPTVAADPDGGVVIAWQSRDQDGDSWGVVARRFEDVGTPASDEVLLNAATAGHQQGVRLAVAEDGQWLATWTSGSPDGAGWEAVAASFESDGTADGSAIVSSANSGVDSGHQQASAVVVNGEDATVVWTGAGGDDHHGVYQQPFDVELIDNGPQESPNLAPITDRQQEVGEPFELTVTATDPNPRDELTFFLDPNDSPAGATIEQIDNYTAVIRWTPADEDEGLDILFRVLVTDDGEPTLADSEEFTVTVGALPVTVDLNGTDADGLDSTADFLAGGGAAGIVDDAFALRGADDGVVAGATATLTATPDGDDESLGVDTLDTAITAAYVQATRTLTLSGEDTAENYRRVLRTLAYDNGAATANGDREVTIAVTDGGGDTGSSVVTVRTVDPDLAAFAQAIADSGTQFFGAGWCPSCTEQKELFEDGGQYLPFVEVTNPDRTPNDVAEANDIDVYPTWVFSDGTRLEGIQSLETLASRSGVEIPASDDPFLAELPDETLLVGSPLHVPLDGYDPNGGPLTYTVTSDNPDVTAEILSGNRSARMNVAGYGDLVFELFEGRADRATERMIELAGDDFYDDLLFHRVVNGFIIQGGDPDGNSTGGSTLGDFDDQFHPDLQHNRSGLLSMAKSTDDTNDSQFFITEGATRNLDFNHTIFGLLVEGESNREAISNTAVTINDAGNEISKPINEVVMEGIEIFDDTENGVLFLKAADGATGSANITVTVTDQNGNTFDRTFRVDLADDTVNGSPYLTDIAPVTAARNTVAEVQLASVDVEGDPVFYSLQRRGTVNYTATVSDTGLLEVTPPDDFVGTLEILVGVGSVANTPDDLQVLEIEFT